MNRTLFYRLPGGKFCTQAMQTAVPEFYAKNWPILASKIPAQLICPDRVHEETSRNTYIFCTDFWTACAVYCT